MFVYVSVFLSVCPFKRVRAVSLSVGAHCARRPARSLLTLSDTQVQKFEDLMRHMQDQLHPTLKSNVTHNTTNASSCSAAAAGNTDACMGGLSAAAAGGSKQKASSVQTETGGVGRCEDKNKHIRQRKEEQGAGQVSRSVANAQRSASGSGAEGKLGRGRRQHGGKVLGQVVRGALGVAGVCLAVMGSVRPAGSGIGEGGIVGALGLGTGRFPFFSFPLGSRLGRLTPSTGNSATKADAPNGVGDGGKDGSVAKTAPNPQRPQGPGIQGFGEGEGAKDEQKGKQRFDKGKGDGIASGGEAAPEGARGRWIGPLKPKEGTTIEA